MTGLPASRMSRHPRKRKGWFGNLSAASKTITVALAVMISLALALTAAVGWFLWRATSTFDRGAAVVTEAFPDDELRPEEDDDTETILLIGSDTRGEVDDEILEGAIDGRSDTIMVARIPKDRDAVVLVSIMRDSWVDIPGFGDAKVNAALAYGGIPLTVQTLEDLLDTRIDHVAIIDFNGFKGMTDALGGVTVNNDREFSAGGFDYPEGEITLSGEEALMFVRTRKAFGDGDYQRVRNQQKYMKAAGRQLLSRDTLTSPSTVLEVVSQVSPFLTVSEGFNGRYLMGLAPSMRNVRAEDMFFVTAPTEGVGVSADGQSIVILDPEGMDELRQAFRDDTLVEYAETHG